MQSISVKKTSTVDLPKCSIIIPCYFANEVIVEMTLNCLDSLSNTTDDQPDEIIIIDDGSPLPIGFADESDQVQQFQTYHREKNGGYAAAVNTGLWYAQGDILILGNNDLIFTENWLEGLLMPLREGYDISTVWTSDQENVELVEDIEPMARFGSLLAMRREVYDILGGFDEQFRGYFSDLDYRRRALDEGFTIGKNLNCVVEHMAKGTYRHTDPNDDEFYRSMRLYEIKHGDLE